MEHDNYRVEIRCRCGTIVSQEARLLSVAVANAIDGYNVHKWATHREEEKDESMQMREGEGRKRTVL